MIIYKSIPYSSDETYICATMTGVVEEHSSAQELIEKVDELKGKAISECLSAFRSMGVVPSDDALLFGLVEIVGVRDFGENFYHGHNYNDNGISSGVEVMIRTLTARK
jgi:hypothetical protein